MNSSGLSLAARIQVHPSKIMTLLTTKVKHRSTKTERINRKGWMPNNVPRSEVSAYLRRD
jgi:hypothetical protein